MALPLLDAMTPIRARAAAPVTAKPRRSVFVYIPNGVNGMTWQCTQHRADFTVCSGLHHPNCLGEGHVCADTWLTGAKIEAQSGRKYENSISCDQVMAEVVGQQTRFSALELVTTAGTGHPFNATTRAFSRDGVPLPGEDNPRVVFERLFGEAVGGV